MTWSRRSLQRKKKVSVFGRRLAWRGARRPAHAKQRRRKLHQRSFARESLRFPVADDRYHAWRVGRNESLADPDGSDYRQNPPARRRDRLRSDKTGSSSPDRRSGRTHLFQRRTRGRDSALAAHAWHKTFQRLTDGRREQAAASRRDRSNPGGTPGHAGGNWAGLADV